ncbi:hypothetical protein D9M68_941170 [compost metagenome]
MTIVVSASSKSLIGILIPRACLNEWCQDGPGKGRLLRWLRFMYIVYFMVSEVVNLRLSGGESATG